MSQRQTGKLARWQLDLEQYDFKITYVKGKNNPVADYLSRDVVEPLHLIEECIKMVHGSKLCAHGGIEKKPHEKCLVSKHGI